MLQVSIVVGVLASLAVALRFLARSRSKTSLALDDWFLVGSLLPLYGMLAISVLRRCTSTITEKAAKRLTQKKVFDTGLGLPVTSLDAQQIPKLLKVP